MVVKQFWKTYKHFAQYVISAKVIWNKTMNDLIEKIKKIMTDVATGQAKIQDTNDEYKKLFRELDDIFSSTNQKNPNGFSDLWEFYSFWKKLVLKKQERQ